MKIVTMVHLLNTQTLLDVIIGELSPRLVKSFCRYEVSSDYRICVPIKWGTLNESVESGVFSWEVEVSASEHNVRGKVADYLKQTGKLNFRLLFQEVWAHDTIKKEECHV